MSRGWLPGRPRGRSLSTGRSRGRSRVGTLVLLPLAALALAACGSTPSPGASTSTSPSPSDTGLRGMRIESLVCGTSPGSVGSSTAVPVTGTPREYLVCAIPGVSSPSTSPSVRVREGDTAVFTSLTAALSTPDVPPEPDRVCAAYADMPREVLLRTSDGAWSVHIPSDGCGHYLVPVLAVLNAAQQ